VGSISAWAETQALSSRGRMMHRTLDGKGRG
jgi:hypothetical protein